RRSERAGRDQRPLYTSPSWSPVQRSGSCRLWAQGSPAGRWHRRIVGQGVLRVAPVPLKRRIVGIPHGHVLVCEYLLATGADEEPRPHAAQAVLAVFVREDVVGSRDDVEHGPRGGLAHATASCCSGWSVRFRTIEMAGKRDRFSVTAPPTSSSGAFVGPLRA